jgi:hypothetical protein
MDRRFQCLLVGLMWFPLMRTRVWEAGDLGSA